MLAARRIEGIAKLAFDLAERYPGRAIEAQSLDIATMTADDLKRLDVWCVADCAGPFQGSAPRSAEIAILARRHYIDISDARDFTANFPALDAAAKAAGVLCVSGASSTPGLAQAVLDDLVRGWQRIDRIEIAISPGNRAPRGLAVVQAILATAGQPVKVFRNGTWSTATGWGLLTRRRLPGLGRRWLSLVETPDLDLMPQRFAPKHDGVFRAGLELSVLHLGLWFLSRLVALRLLPSARFLAPVARRAADWFLSFGTDRGGMAVTAEGLDASGEGITATWAVVAKAGDGPNIPVLPAAAVIRALAADKIAERGAMPCVGLVTRDDIVREFARFRIVTRMNTQAAHALRARAGKALRAPA